MIWPRGKFLKCRTPLTSNEQMIIVLRYFCLSGFVFVFVFGSFLVLLTTAWLLLENLSLQWQGKLQSQLCGCQCRKLELCYHTDPSTSELTPRVQSTALHQWGLGTQWSFLEVKVWRDGFFFSAGRWGRVWETFLYLHSKLQLVTAFSTPPLRALPLFLHSRAISVKISH